MRMHILGSSPCRRKPIDRFDFLERLTKTKSSKDKNDGRRERVEEEASSKADSFILWT